MRLIGERNRQWLVHSGYWHQLLTAVLAIFCFLSVGVQMNAHERLNGSVRV